MLKKMILGAVLSGVFMTAPVALNWTGNGAFAQYQGMSCGDLWYARNDIYAAKGHCFKTRRGRKAYGSECNPPYGKLNRSEQRRVNRIKKEERRRGC